MSAAPLNAGPQASPPPSGSGAQGVAATSAAHKGQKGPAVGFEALLAILNANQDSAQATAVAAGDVKSSQKAGGGGKIKDDGPPSAASDDKDVADGVEAEEDDATASAAAAVAAAPPITPQAMILALAAATGAEVSAQPMDAPGQAPSAAATGAATDNAAGKADLLAAAGQKMAAEAALPMATPAAEAPPAKDFTAPATPSAAAEAPEATPAAPPPPKSPVPAPVVTAAPPAAPAAAPVAEAAASAAANATDAAAAVPEATAAQASQAVAPSVTRPSTTESRDRVVGIKAPRTDGSRPASAASAANPTAGALSAKMADALENPDAPDLALTSATSEESGQAGLEAQADTSSAPAAPAAPDTNAIANPTAGPTTLNHAATVAATELRAQPQTVASLAAQIVKKLDGRTSRFDVALDPVGLGHVNVRVEIGATGKMSAALAFDTPQAAAELRGRAAELHTALQQAGFDLTGGLTFDVAGERGQGQAAPGQDDQSGPTFRGRAFQTALDTVGDAATASQFTYRGSSASGVDIRI